MASNESIDGGARLGASLDEARRLLRRPEAVDPAWPAVAAAALFAICAMGFATAAILTPPPSLPTPAAREAEVRPAPVSGGEVGGSQAAGAQRSGSQTSGPTMDLRGPT
jgi:hypothetical protein